MAGFKDNLDEQYERVKYQKEQYRWQLVAFIVIAVMILAVISNFGNRSIFGYFIHVPFGGDNKIASTLLLFLFLSVYIWINGFPKKLHKLLSKFFSNKILNGQKTYLQEFFYPSVTFSDNIPRAKDFKYFKSNKHNIYNLFDFGTYTAKNGTNEIIKLFRDKRYEKTVAMQRSGRKEIREKGEHILRSIQNEYWEKGLPTPDQEHLYTDLFLMLEGTYNSYENDFGDKIFIKSMRSPLYVEVDEKNKKLIKEININTESDVFQKGKVFFSIDMIIGTAMRLTYLYTNSLEKRLGKGRFINIDKNKKKIAKFEMYFKFYIVRWLLLNYSNIPSGWICAKTEDYTSRAIASDIDRPMLIDINDKNDGTNPNYKSDAEATDFLFTYWAFRYEKKMIPIFEELEFIFNATKEFKEINAREVARKATEELKKELDQTYSTMKDEDLIFLDTSDKEGDK